MTKEEKTLEQCYMECDNFDQFCEHCNKQVNEVTDMTAQEVYEELQAKYEDKNQ